MEKKKMKKKNQPKYQNSQNRSSHIKYKLSPLEQFLFGESFLIFNIEKDAEWIFKIWIQINENNVKKIHYLFGIAAIKTIYLMKKKFQQRKDLNMLMK